MENTIGGNASLLELGLSEVYKETLKATPETWKTWLDSRTVKRYVDYEMSTSGLGPSSEKPPGSPFATDRIFSGPRKAYTLITYGIAIVLQHELLKWEWYGVYDNLAQGLAKSQRNKYEVIAYSILNRAFDTTSAVYADYNGEALCAVAHTRLDGGTWQNRPTDDVALSMDGLETMWEQMRKLPNHRGFYQGLKPARLVIPIEQAWLANTLLMSTTDPGNANDAYNNARALNLKVQDSEYITDPFFWFAFASKDTYRVKMGLGEDPDLKTFPVPATRSMTSNSLCSFRVEVHEGMGIWGSRGQ